MSVSKRKRSNLFSAPYKKRKSTSTVEEISFDPSAREEFLTGFHKRKLQRIQHAKEIAIKREREERITARRLLREERKVYLERHVQAVNTLLKEAGEVKDGEDEGLEGEETGKPGLEEGLKGAKEVPDLNQREEYVDEEKFTTVTVEAVDVARDGLRPVRDKKDEGDEEDEVNVEGRGDGRGKTKHQASIDRSAEKIARKKRKKFRYESKAERKITRQKERIGSRAWAKMRRKKS